MPEDVLKYLGECFRKSRMDIGLTQEQLSVAVFFFAKLGMTYFDFRKHGQFEWSGPAILFACLVFTLTAPLYIWTILGI